MVVVESEIEVEVAAELGIDVWKHRSDFRFQQIRSRTFVGQRRPVPRSRKLRARMEANAREIGKYGRRAGASQHVGSERVEGSANINGLSAVEGRSPEIGGVLKCDEPLLAARRAGVAADRRSRGRIVEAFVGSVNV